MNRLSFTPTINNNYPVNNNTIRQQPTFKGNIPKKAIAKPKQTLTLINRMYQLFFVPFGEKVMNIKNGCVYTKKIEDNVPKAIERKLFSFKPIRKKRINEDKVVTTEYFNTNLKKDIEISDKFNPKYNISVRYNEGENAEDKKIILTCLDSTVEVNEDQRIKLLKELEETLEEKYPVTFEDMKKASEEGRFQEYYDNFYKLPETTAINILSSPEQLSEHLDERVSHSMYNGIKCIMEAMKVA